MSYATSTVNTNLGFVVTPVYNKTIEVPLPGMNYTWSVPSVNYYRIFTLMSANEAGLGLQLTNRKPIVGTNRTQPSMGYYGTGGGEESGNVYNGI